MGYEINEDTRTKLITEYHTEENFETNKLQSTRPQNEKERSSNTTKNCIKVPGNTLKKLLDQ